MRASAVARVYNQLENLEQRARALDLWASLVTDENDTIAPVP